MFKRYLIFQNCAFLYMSFFFFTFHYISGKIPYFSKLCFLLHELPFLYISGNFPSAAGVRGKEKEAHIQENTTLRNKVSFKHIFQPL